MAKAASAGDETMDIGEVFKQAKRVPLNFALLVSKDKEQGMVLETHRKKAPEVLLRNARKKGGGRRGARGVMSISGKIVEMRCEDEAVPGNLPKLAKKHFMSQGHNYKFIFILPNGETIGEGEAEDGSEDGELVAEDSGAADPADTDAAPATATAAGGGEDGRIDAARATMMKSFEAVKQPLKDALTKVDPETRNRLGTLAKTFGTEVKGRDMRKAAGVLKLLRSTLETAQAGATAGAEAEAEAEAGSDPALVERRGNRLARLDALEADVDTLLARFATHAAGGGQ